MPSSYGGAGSYGWSGGTTGTPQDPGEAATRGLGRADTTTVQGNRLSPTLGSFGDRWAVHQIGLTPGIGGWPDSGIPGWGSVGSIPPAAAALAGALQGDPQAAPALSTFGTTWNAWGGGVPPDAARRAPSIVGGDFPPAEGPTAEPASAGWSLGGASLLGMALGNAAAGPAQGASASGALGQWGAPGMAPVTAARRPALPASSAPAVLGYGPVRGDPVAAHGMTLSPLGAFGNTNAAPFGTVGLGGWSQGPSSAGGRSFGGIGDNGSINGQSDRSLH